MGRMAKSTRRQSSLILFKATIESLEQSGTPEPHHHHSTLLKTPIQRHQTTCLFKQVEYVSLDRCFVPSAEQASDRGIVAVGGDLKLERVMLAYRKVFFPGLNLMTFTGGAQTPGWSCPDQVKISKSMRAVLRKNSLKDLQ